MSKPITCSCGNKKAKSFHLACTQCWALVPKPLQDKLWHFYRTARGSGDHHGAMRECLLTIQKARVANATAPLNFDLSRCQHPHGMPCLAHKAVIEGGEAGAALACPNCAPHVERTRLLLGTAKLAQSGYGGVNKERRIVDRRTDPTAFPIPENALMNIPKPLSL